jgi:hypothetical protein
MFQRDPNGQEILNPATGKPIPTPNGNAIFGYLEVLHKAGVVNPQAQWDLAVKLVERDLYRPAAANAAAVQQGQAQQNNVIQNMNRRAPNASGSMVDPATTGHLGPAQQNEGLSLREQLRLALQQGGYTDAHIAATAVPASV